MGLIGIPRGAELHLFDLNYISDYSHYFLLEIPGTVKNIKEGAPRPDPVEISRHEEDEKLCPVACFRKYVALTEPWRDSQGLPSALFLSYQAPHKPVSRSTLARWIKEALHQADIDTKVFQAHSLRGASTSQALLKGLSVKEVINHGRWSLESTWQRFYHRRIESAAKKYQDAILKL